MRPSSVMAVLRRSKAKSASAELSCLSLSVRCSDHDFNGSNSNGGVCGGSAQNWAEWMYFPISDRMFTVYH